MKRVILIILMISCSFCKDLSQRQDYKTLIEYETPQDILDYFVALEEYIDYVDEMTRIPFLPEYKNLYISVGDFKREVDYMINYFDKVMMTFNNKNKSKIKDIINNSVLYLKDLLEECTKSLYLDYKQDYSLISNKEKYFQFKFPDIPNIVKKQMNYDDIKPKPYTPIDDIKPKPYYPIDDIKPKPYYPIDDIKPKPYYPIDDIKPKPHYPIDDIKPKPYTPIDDIKPKPYTPIDDIKPKPYTPIDDIKPKPYTPIDDIKPKPYSPIDDLNLFNFSDEVKRYINQSYFINFNELSSKDLIYLELKYTNIKSVFTKLLYFYIENLKKYREKIDFSYPPISQNEKDFYTKRIEIEKNNIRNEVKSLNKYINEMGKEIIKLLYLG